MKILFTIIAAILLVDAFGFALWALSGQVPVDNIYLGTITTHAIQYLAPGDR